MSALSNYEMDLLEDWLTDMKNQELDFQKSIITMKIIEVTNYCCNILKQDVHVFLISLRALEVYLGEKDKKNKKIDDPALIIITTVFISSKYAGQDIKIKYFEDLLVSLTGQQYSTRAIELQEIEILTTLNNNLPVGTVADDLTTLLAKFEKHYQLKVSVIPACLEILELFYLTRDTWFHDIKEMYNVGTEARIVFNSLMKSRFYVPLGILGYVLKYSVYKDILDTDNILKHLALKAHIHSDHVFALINKFRTAFLNIPD